MDFHHLFQAILDLGSNFQYLILVISVTLLLLQNMLWSKQKFVGMMQSVCLTQEARQMNGTTSSSLSNDKYMKTCISYHMPLHHQRGDGLATQGRYQKKSCS